MNTKKPTAVLIHGHHLQAPEWERLVWGIPRLSQVGRIPRGLEMAVKESAELIIWGTGASKDPQTGKLESEYTRDFATRHIGELAAYLGIGEAEVRVLLEERSELQRTTTNTKNETYEALKLCKDRGIHTLYLVSSPTHVPRCLLTAVQYQEEFAPVVLCGVAAETATEFWSPKDVAIVEPSHRPDRSEVPMNLLAKRMASARKYPEHASRLYDDLKARLDAFDAETPGK